MQNLTDNEKKKESFYTVALRIAERNLTSGIWTIETASIFLIGAEEQPENVLAHLN